MKHRWQCFLLLCSFFFLSMLALQAFSCLGHPPHHQCFGRDERKCSKDQRTKNSKKMLMGAMILNACFTMLSVSRIGVACANVVSSRPCQETVYKIGSAPFSMPKTVQRQCLCVTRVWFLSLMVDADSCLTQRLTLQSVGLILRLMLRF